MTDPTPPSTPDSEPPRDQNGAPLFPPPASGQPTPPPATPSTPPPAADATQPYPPAPPAGDQPYPPASSQYTAPGAAPFPPAISYPDRTNPVSIVAIVLGFIVPIGGIIAGIVALTQIKRTGEKGRGLALTGIIAGAALTVLYLIAIIGFFVFAAVMAAQVEQAASSIPDDPFSSSAPFEDPSTTPEDDTTDGTQTDAFTLAVGDCFNDDSISQVTSVELLDCGAPHDYEVYSDATVPEADTYPGEDAVTSQAETVCYDAYPAFVGIAYEDSTLNYSYLYPTEESWAEGDRLISCLLVDPAGQTSGSLQGSAR